VNAVADLIDSPSTTTTTRFETVADEATVERTTRALEAHGFTVLRAANAAEAKRIVLDLIPEGAQVHHGASKTLEVTGITEALESGSYEAVRPAVQRMDRATQGDEIRHLTAAPAIMLGSVHAVTETGSLIAASMGGAQLGPYLSGAGRVIVVVGTQKIVADQAEGFRRIEEHALPLEDARALAAYGIHSAINKVAIISGEVVPGRITVVLVDEALGF
jgi:L-lactate utilization protein LutC